MASARHSKFELTYHTAAERFVIRDQVSVMLKQISRAICVSVMLEDLSCGTI
jgi:hypothetical protein